ncbi:hypothetical protein, partial [Nocardia farcinica]|uniref:hypothetical protein n=1 Tax=Nocardia farcinica TaxID=37329 RepID=UPI003CC7D3E0
MRGPPFEIPGWGPSRAIASVVRATPIIRASSEPAAASTAPARTSGVSHPAPAASTTRASGSTAVARP